MNKLGVTQTLISLLLIVLMITSLTSASGYHTTGQGPFIRLLTPIVDFLSGPVWLRLKGVDIYEPSPKLSASPGGLGAIPVKLPYRVPSPKFSRNLLISIDVGRIPYQAETSIAVNPRDPDNIVIGMNDYGFFSPSAYVSLDGGESWNGPYPMAPIQRDYYGSDVSLAFDRNGNVYFTYMSIGFKVIRVGGIIVGDEKASIVISKSTDGGFTWSAPKIVAIGDIYASANEVMVVFLDRPRMTIGPDPEDPSKDRIYVTYTEFVLRYPIIPVYPYVMAPLVSTTIKLSYSTDGGETWSKPVAVSPTYSYWVGEERRRIVQGSNPKVSRNGTLFVAYYDSLDDGPWEGLFAPTIVWSLDGGKSFSQPRHVDYLLEIDYELSPTLFRAWVSMMPQIDVGPESEVYLVVAARPSIAGADDCDIFFYRSLDGGRTWSIAKRLNDDRTDRDQFIPAIAVSPNGTIHVSWGDRRDDPKDVEYHIYYTRSGDRGETWMQNTRVTDYPSNPNYGLYLYIGDYWSIAATNEDVYIAWTDTRLGRAGSPNMKIGFARTRHIPMPTIFISPPSGPAGKEVTIIGEHFMPDGEVFLKVGETYISALKTDEDGTFKTKIFMPMLGEGAYKVEAVDLSGNRAEAYFYCEFGLDTIKKELESIMEGYDELLSKIREPSELISKMRGERQNLTMSIKLLEEKASGLEEDIAFLTWITKLLTVLLAMALAISMFLAFRLRRIERK